MSGFDVEVSVAADVGRIRGHASALTLLFHNLIDNAMKYSPGRRHLRLSARTDRQTVTIDVADSGMHFPPDEIRAITRKFVRGRHAESSGTVLGLAIAGRIAQDHGGSLNIQSVEGSGTIVSVTLPVP